MQRREEIISGKNDYVILEPQIMEQGQQEIYYTDRGTPYQPSAPPPPTNPQFSQQYVGNGRQPPPGTVCDQGHIHNGIIPPRQQQQPQTVIIREYNNGGFNNGFGNGRGYPDFPYSCAFVDLVFETLRVWQIPKIRGRGRGQK